MSEYLVYGALEGNESETIRVDANDPTDALNQVLVEFKRASSEENDTGTEVAVYIELIVEIVEGTTILGPEKHEVIA